MLVAGLSETPRGSAAGVLGLLAGRLPEAGEVAGLLGDVLWVVTYVLIIRAGFRSREYGIPLTAIALNFTWELIYGVLYPPGAVAARVLHGAWLALDLVIVIQLVRYGKAVQTHSLIRRFFYPIVAVTLVLAFIGHLLFRRQFVTAQIMPDSDGLISAYAINLVMSVLFVFFLPGRHTRDALSVGAAWTKCLGTGLVSLGNYLAHLGNPPPLYNVQYHPVGEVAWTSLPPRHLLPVNPDFLWYLAATVFLFDLLYIRLLYRLPAAPSRPATDPTPVRSG
ncbi:MAG TPA: hypothetical protein VGA78_14490 [Gemmatimonadales bacterium]